MEDTDTFTHAGKEYDLKKTRELLRSEKSFLVPTKDLVWIFKYDKPSEDRIAKAKLRYPLLVSKYQGRWAVVDGLHRLELYRRRGIKVVPVKEVTTDILEKTYIKKARTLF